MGDLPHVPGTSTSQIESSDAFWLSYDFFTGGNDGPPPTNRRDNPRSARFSWIARGYT